MPELVPGQNRGAKFVSSALWSSVGVVVSLIIGLVLSPYLIRKLGSDGYGVWTLTFAMVEYYWLLDLGFRSATVKYVAHHWTLGDATRTGEVISTALVYSSGAASLILVGLTVAAPWIQTKFQVSPAYQSTFLRLLIITTASWCISIVFGVFGAAMEAVQRFDLSTQANITGTLVRTGGTFLLLYSGYGLVELAVLAGLSQILTFVLQYRSFRQVFPRLPIAPRHASFAVVRNMMGFGIHTFLGNVSQQAMTQSAPLLIGHFFPAAFVGYYLLPARLLQYTADVVGRIGAVINSNAAEMSARKDYKAVGEMAIYSNRYSLAVFMPLAIFLAIQGTALFKRWVGPEFASHSAPVLPVMLLGSMIALVGQYCSTMLLQGLAKHQIYARGLMVEAILGVVVLWLAIPAYGIVGAAWVSTIFMLSNRCLFLAWLTSRAVGMPFARFLRGVYAAPLLAALPVAGLMWWLHQTLLPGTSWAQLGIAALLSGILYYPVVFFFGLSPSHRELLLGWVRRAPAQLLHGS